MKHRAGQRQKSDNNPGTPPPQGAIPPATDGTPPPSPPPGSSNSRLEKIGAEIAELRLRLAKLAAERNRKPKEP